MKTSALVESLQNRLKGAGVDNARRVAEELLAHLIGCRPLEIYLNDHTLPAEKFGELGLLAARIERGEPLQYVVGHVDFWGLEIHCDRRALIPRPETELLVEEVLSSGIWKRGHAAVADVGTGTGCIVITLAAQRPDADFKAVDLSADALELARENARRHGLEERILWLQNDLLEDLAPGSLDGVVANLPYIPTGDWEQLHPSVRDHEPKSALDSGPSGLAHIKRLAEQARSILVSGGMLFLEFGHDQGDAVHQILDALGYTDIQIKHDLAGHDRIAIAVNP